MKNQYIYILTFLSLLFLPACDDRLDVEPTLSISEETAFKSILIYWGLTRKSHGTAPFLNQGKP